MFFVNVVTSARNDLGEGGEELDVVVDVVDDVDVKVTTDVSTAIHTQ